LHPQTINPVLATCAEEVRARAVQVVEPLRACYKWTAEWLDPLFRTQNSGAWGPMGSDVGRLLEADSDSGM